MSSWVRFYTLHALVFFLACVAVYRLFTGAKGWLERGSDLLLAAGGFALAVHLQVTTAAGVAGLGLWIGLVALAPAVGRLKPGWRRIAAGAAVVLIPAALAAAFLQTEQGAALLDRLRYVDLWAEESRDDVGYYYSILREQYPALWTLLPIGVLIAASAHFRETLLCTCIFAVGFVAHSLVAWKSERYLFYLLPMFFAVWGLAVGAALPWLRDRIHAAVTAAGALQMLPARTARQAEWALLFAALAFAAATSRGVSHGFKMVTVSDAAWRWPDDPYRIRGSWSAAEPALRPLLEGSEVVLASSDVQALYAFGRTDVILRAYNTPAGPVPEFGTWWKTGVPVISTAGSLARVMGCYRTGLVVMEDFHLGSRWNVPADAAEYLQQHAAQVAVPPETGIVAFRWRTPGSSLDPSGCAQLPQPPEASRK